MVARKVLSRRRNAIIVHVAEAPPVAFPPYPGYPVPEGNHFEEEFEKELQALEQQEKKRKLN